MFFMTIENKDDRLKVERLYYAYRKLLYKEAYAILNDKHLAEDAVSETFIRIINNLHKIDENNCPRTRSFLVIICRNVAKDIYKKRRKLHQYEDLSGDLLEEEDQASNPLDIVINKETIQRIAKVIESLDLIYRDVFLLRRVHGMTCEEIAGMFGIKTETVKKRLTRAKHKIMEELEKERG